MGSGKPVNILLRGNKSPYELVEDDDKDFHELMSLLKMHLIPPDEVHLMPDLFVEK